MSHRLSSCQCRCEYTGSGSDLSSLLTAIRSELASLGISIRALAAAFSPDQSECHVCHTDALGIETKTLVLSLIRPVAQSYQRLRKLIQPSDVIKEPLVVERGCPNRVADRGVSVQANAFQLDLWKQKYDQLTKIHLQQQQSLKEAQLKVKELQDSVDELQSAKSVSHETIRRADELAEHHRRIATQATRSEAEAQREVQILHEHIHAMEKALEEKDREIQRETLRRKLALERRSQAYKLLQHALEGPIPDEDPLLSNQPSTYNSLRNLNPNPKGDYPVRRSSLASDRLY